MISKSDNLFAVAVTIFLASLSPTLNQGYGDDVIFFFLCIVTHPVELGLRLLVDSSHRLLRLSVFVASSLYKV